MKNRILFSLVLLLSFTLVSDSFAQSFYTGAIGVTQSNGGRTRIFSDNLTTRLFDRASVLVGVSSSAVFDYNQDQNGLVNAATVTNPLLSNFEVTSTINNSYSNLPPNVEVAINLYGWTNGSYILGKLRVKNNETTPINAVIGLEVIPQIDGAYGAEVVQHHLASNTTLINKTKWAGIRFFSTPQTALKSIQWVSGYGTDQLYYSWLTQNSFDAPLTAGVDGSVAILGSNAVNIAVGATVEFYFGVSMGTDQASCLANMDLCFSRYTSILPVELTSFNAKAIGNSVKLDWVTATEINNRGFEIERKFDDNWVVVGYVEGKGTTTIRQSYTFTDFVESQSTEKIVYRLKQLDYDGMYSYSNEVEVEFSPVPTHLELEQNFPNPFNPATSIRYSLPAEGFVTLKVYDAIGNEISTLVSENQNEGLHSINFNASEIPSGIYFYSISFNNQVKTNKMILIK